MIVSQMMGGLGNQMYQYAAGKALSHRLKATLKLDISRYDWDDYRQLEIDHFNISAPTANKLEQLCFSAPTKFPIKYLPAKFYPVQVFTDKKFSYDPKFTQLNGNIYLSGTWHTHKYFQGIEPTIRDEYQFKSKLSADARPILELIKKSSAVFVHVRRGDYVTSAKFSKFHPAQSIDYYKQAMSEINAKVRNPKYFIFSDDIGWCRKNLDIKNAVFVSEQTKSGIEDLQLMTKCQHAIIANSSFSWWGAWLISNQKKVVVAPKKWFADRSVVSKDIYLPEWKVI